MPKRLQVSLQEEQRSELQQTRDHHPKPYMREKAAAILKIAEEHQSALQVAQHGLLKRRDDYTVRRWLARYLDCGLAGLLVGKGRGRKPAFFPSGPLSSRRAGARDGVPQPRALQAGSAHLDA